MDMKKRFMFMMKTLLFVTSVVKLDTLRPNVGIDLE